jgi:hypothetical protein
MLAIKAMRGRRDQRDTLGSVQPVQRDRLDKPGRLGSARRVRPAMLVSRVMLEPPERLVQRDLQVVPPALPAQPALRATTARRDQPASLASRGQAAGRQARRVQPEPVLQVRRALPARRVLSARWGHRVQLGKPAPLASRVMMGQQALPDTRALLDRPGAGQPGRPEMLEARVRPEMLGQRVRPAAAALLAQLGRVAPPGQPEIPAQQDRRAVAVPRGRLARAGQPDQQEILALRVRPAEAALRGQQVRQDQLVPPARMQQLSAWLRRQPGRIKERLFR